MDIKGQSVDLVIDDSGNRRHAFHFSKWSGDTGKVHWSHVLGGNRMVASFENFAVPVCCYNTSSFEMELLGFHQTCDQVSNVIF